MAGILKVDTLQRVGSDSDQITLSASEVRIHKGAIVDSSGEEIVSSNISGQILQVSASQSYTPHGTHLPSTGNQTVALGQTFPQDVAITQKSATSVNEITFWVSMANGQASQGVLIWNLLGKINSGSFTSVCSTPSYNSEYTAASPDLTTSSTGLSASNGGHQPRYGWSYDNSPWGPRLLRFYHRHGQVKGTVMTYRMTCYNSGSGGTNYMNHMGKMISNWRVEEIGNIGGS